MTIRLHQSAAESFTENLLKQLLVRDTDNSESINNLLEQPINFSSRILEEDFLDSHQIRASATGSKWTQAMEPLENQKPFRVQINLTTDEDYRGHSATFMPNRPKCRYRAPQTKNNVTWFSKSPYGEQKLDKYTQTNQLFIVIGEEQENTDALHPPVSGTRSIGVETETEPNVICSAKMNCQIELSKLHEELEKIHALVRQLKEQYELDHASRAGSVPQLDKNSDTFTWELGETCVPMAVESDALTEQHLPCQFTPIGVDMTLEDSVVQKPRIGPPRSVQVEQVTLDPCSWFITWSKPTELDAIPDIDSARSSDSEHDLVGYRVTVNGDSVKRIPSARITKCFLRLSKDQVSQGTVPKTVGVQSIARNGDLSEVVTIQLEVKG
ncbi:hypothetical protein FGIG_09363 [Fasciola gigantica]|uniref:RIMS-binding protein 1/2/3 Fn3 domain-containing protein n=1 Tax=Fasciola gigantica TaxID=46835 RepID=A0A504Z666_FASGI|nr:hypothetical protein FGIG_09363 [Fasciola gigantica]